LVEYIRRTVILYRKYTSVPMVFKCAEIVAIIVFVFVYTSGRVFGYSIYSPYTMKIMLSFGLLYFYYRLFTVHLPISPTLGPLLYRLKLMLTVDFINFMRMALLVVCSSGVVLQSVMYPDSQFSLELFRVAFHRAFFAQFLTPVGELEGKTNFITYSKIIYHLFSTQTIQYTYSSFEKFSSYLFQFNLIRLFFKFKLYL
jgi:hypothetical protein